MGQSKSIQDLDKQQTEVQAFMKRLNDDANAELLVGRAAIKDMVDTKYQGAKIDDAAQIVFDFKADSTVMSEWSLANVSKIVNATASALFGKSDPNSAKVTLDEKVKAGIEALGSLELYVASQAMMAITGILDVFLSTTSATTLRKGSAKDVAPGMTMFMWISEMTYKDTQFFTQDFVAQNVYVFDVRFSPKEAALTSKMLDVQLYESLKSDYRAKIAEYGAKIALPATTMEQITAYSATITLLQGLMDKQTALITALETQASAATHALVARARARAVPSL